MATQGAIEFRTYDVLDPRLKRFMMHDPRSRNHPVAASRAKYPTKNVRHERKADIWDQGEIGDCTANAFLGMLMTEPLHSLAGGKWAFTEKDCVPFYSLETKLDNAVIPGVYPPNDTGSTFLYAAKAGQQLRYIRSYQHAFGLAQTLNLLVDYPINLGIDWYEGMMDTDRKGFVKPGGRLAGGHEICVDEINSSGEYIGFSQSWGESWGRSGRGYMTWASLDALLRADGDVGTVSV